MSYGVLEPSGFITSNCASNLVVTLTQVIKPLESQFPRQWEGVPTVFLAVL